MKEGGVALPMRELTGCDRGRRRARRSEVAEGVRGGGGRGRDRGRLVHLFFYLF